MGRGSGRGCIYCRCRTSYSLEAVSCTFSVPVPFSFHLCPCALPRRIKQPVLKLHAGKDAACKPCHVAPLAPVCGSDGHTYSSVVRTRAPAGRGGCH